MAESTMTKACLIDSSVTTNTILLSDRHHILGGNQYVTRIVSMRVFGTEIQYGCECDEQWLLTLL